MKKLYAFMLIYLALSGCSSTSLNTVEFLKWVETSKKIVSVKTIDNFEFSIKYLPVAFLALRDIKNKKYDQKDITENTKNYLDSYNMIFKISDKDHNKDVLGDGVETKADYQKRMDYYISALQNDLLLADGNDTIRCVLCNFERTYNMNPYLTFYLLFDKKGRQTEYFDHDLTLVYDDRALGTGRVNLTLSKTDLNAIPQLKIP